MSQKEQLRLIFLCLGLVLVFVVMRKAAQPAFWHWLVPPESATEEITSPEQTVIKMTVQAEDESQPASPNDLLTAVPVFLNEEQKATLKDDHVGIRQSEANLYHQILSQIKQVDPEALKLEAASQSPPPTYQLLMAETDNWRGKLITLEGKAKRIVSTETPNQPDDLGPLYSIWLITPDSGSMPYHVICSELPPNCPTGEALNIPVQVTGCLFKREGYAAEGGLRMTPLLLAANLERVSVDSQLGRKLQSMIPMMTLLALALGGFMTFTLWKMVAKPKPLQRPRPNFMPEPDQEPDFTALEDHDSKPSKQ